MSDPSFYGIETTLNPRRACYVERPADKELVKVLLARKYSFILSSRKVGKSSLIQHSFLSLRQRDVLVASYELPIGVEVDAEQWYFGVASGVVLDAKNRSGFTVDPAWIPWWERNLRLPPMQRFIHLLREFLLTKTEAPWVIAIDEIDTTIPLRFSDDFFAGIRWCYGARASDPLFERLTFLLVGVASPTDLIKDRKRTPFNLGTRVEIADFTAEQARKLLRGLELPEEKDDPALQQVMHWTDGHPYLTQRLFFEIATELDGEIPPDSAHEWRNLVDRVVEKTFFKPGIFVTEAHFQNISESRIESFRHRGQLMTIYGRALRGEAVKDDPLSPAKSELKLSGLLKTDPRAPDHLIVRNRIYKRVFDERWIRENTPVRWARSVALAASLAVLVAVSGLVYQQRRAEAERVGDLIAQIENAVQDVPTRAYDELAARPAQKNVADEKMAAYWERQARKAEQTGTRDEAIVLRLKSRAYHDSPARQLAARVALEPPASEIVATFRHESSVTSANFSADATKVVTVSDDKTARVWDAATGKPIGEPLRHDYSVNSAAFSPDAIKVVTASQDGTARVWDATTGKPIGEPLRHQDSVNSATFSADASKIVTASHDGTARVWDAATGKPLGKPLRHESIVWNATFSADATKVVTASLDGTARVWDAATGKPIGKPLRDDSSVNSATFSADATKVLTASQSAARIWDAGTGKPIGEPLRHQDFVNSAAFSPDAIKVVTASRDWTARVWDVATGKPIGEPLRHQDSVNSATFSADATKIVTASAKTAQVWDAATGKPIGEPLRHQDSVKSAAFSADATKVLTASLDQTARVWEAVTWKPTGKPLRHESSVISAAFSIDATKVVTASQSTARVWDVASGKSLSEPLRHGVISSASLSADATKVITVSQDQTAWVWDAATSKPLGKLIPNRGALNSASFSADATKVVIASMNGAQVWEVDSGKPLGNPLHHDKALWDATFSADATKIVTASFDGTAQVWEVATGKPLGEPMRHEDSVTGASFNSDATKVVTASDDMTGRVWDVASGKPLSEPLRHEGPVTSASFSADGRSVVTLTAACVRFWDQVNGGSFRLGGIRWTRGIEWKPNLRPSHGGERVYVTEAITGDTLVVREISLGREDALLPILTESPVALLVAWQRRLALQFKDETRSPDLVPAYSAPSRRELNINVPPDKH